MKADEELKELLMHMRVVLERREATSLSDFASDLLLPSSCVRSCFPHLSVIDYFNNTRNSVLIQLSHEETKSVIALPLHSVDSSLANSNADVAADFHFSFKVR